MATSPWYREGTAKFTQGSTTVTGTGTRWVDFVRAGDGIQGPDGKLYQVTNVASNTSMSITPAYGSETTYWTIPIQGYVKRLADAASQLVRDFEGGADEALDAADRAKQSATEASASEAAALSQANRAESEADRAETEADRAQQAADDAVAVVSGGEASIDPEPGKIPIAGAEGTIKQAWVDSLEFALDKLRVATNKALYGDGPYPVLDFQFQGARMLDPRIEFTRASKDWGFDAEGNYREFDINQPVFDHDPLTGEPLGIRVWPQRTYMLLNSATFLGWEAISGTALVQSGVKNKYGDTTYKLVSTLDEAPVVRRNMVFSLVEQELVLVCEPSDLPCVMIRVIAGSDIRVVVNIKTLAVLTSGVSADSVKIRRLGGKAVEVRVIYTPAVESGRFDIWAKRNLDTAIGLTDIVAGEHIFISSCFVCNQIGAPYVRTEGSQVTVSSQYLYLDKALANGKGSYLVDILDLGQTSSHAGMIHIKRIYQDTYGAAIRLRAWANYKPALGGSALIRDSAGSNQASLDSGGSSRKKAGITINADGSAFFSMGGEGAALEPRELSDLGRVSLGLVLISGSGERTMRGYIRSFSFYSEPLTEQKLLELTS